MSMPQPLMNCSASSRARVRSASTARCSSPRMPSRFRHPTDGEVQRASRTSAREIETAMNISLLLEMAAEAAPDRIGLVCDGKRWTYAELLSAARGAFELIEQSGAQYFALLDESSEAAVIALFGAALGGVPYCPLNYRL